ncbi:LysM peptidoglycan-binding domain-containing protein [Geodermatophilus sp. SYSU D00815]
MSGRRLLATALAMALVALGLAALGPEPEVLRQAVTHPQGLSDASGPDVVVLAWAALLAWSVWAWGAVGLALTAAGALPGLAGAAARCLLRVVLPAGARRATAVALGIGIGAGLGAPALAVAAPAAPPVTAAPDWPRTPAGTAPDWPQVEAPAAASEAPAPAGDEHVVVRGDCLWDIAEAYLRRTTGAVPGDRAIADAVTAWWSANAAVIGPDPDLLLPGQVLHPPRST